MTISTIKIADWSMITHLFATLRPPIRLIKRKIAPKNCVPLMRTSILMNKTCFHSQESNNLNNVSTFRYSGLVHRKTVGVAPSTDKKGFTVALKTRKNQVSYCPYVDIRIICIWNDVSPIWEVHDWLFSSPIYTDHSIEKKIASINVKHYWPIWY